MEGKHNTSDHYQHEHHNSSGMEATHQRKESHGGWACHQCGWISPNPHPSAKQRRNHKKHCGKIEGFKLINSGDTQKRGASSEEVSSDEEHKSTGHTEKEGQHITSHQHQHEQQLHAAEDYHTKEHHGWVCHRCGWTYPNPHPSAKHRKNHKRHCGKIEGFKLISSRNKEIQGGSSDDELMSRDHERLNSLNANNVASQKNAPPSTLDCTSSNRDNSSTEVNIGAVQTHCVSDNATLELPEATGIDANAKNSIMFGESGKETPVDSTITTVGLGVHGLNASGAVESSKNLIGPDMLISEDKSNLFYEVIPDTDNSQYGSGSVEHQELPIKGHQVQNPRHLEAPKTFGKSAPTPVHAAKEHNIGIGSRRVGIASILSFNRVDSEDLNTKVSSVEEIPAFADAKIYEPSQTNHEVYESEKQEVLVSETKEDKMQHHVAISSDLNEGLNLKLPSGTESQKDYPSSSTFEPETEKLLHFTSSTTAMDSTSLNNLKFKVTEGVIYSQEVEEGTSNKPENYTPSKSISPSASRDSFSSREVEKPSNFSNTNSQDTLNPESDNKKATGVPSDFPKQKTREETEYPCSESIEKIPAHQQASSEVIIPDQERSEDSSSTTYSKAAECKEAESCAFMDLSTIKHDMKICDPNCKKEYSALASEVLDDENSAKSDIPDEKKNTAEYDMFLKPGDYIESKDISPSMHEDSGRYREEEKTPNFEKSNSDVMLQPEEEKEKIINQEAIKGPSSESIESTSGQKLGEQASNAVIPDQETTGNDSFPTEYSKEGEKQQTECSSITSSSAIEHDTKDYNPDCRMADSTPENIVMPTKNIVRDADTPVNEVDNENQEGIKGPSSEGIESTSGKKLDEQASNAVIPDQETSGTDNFPTEYSKEGEKRQTECSSITSFSITERDMKDYNPDCRMADSTPEIIVMTTTNIVRAADTPVTEVANENQKAIKGPSSEDIESTKGQKLDEQASNVVIHDQGTSGTDNFATKYSKEGENQQIECSSITSSSTIEHDMKDYNPECRMADSTPENIIIPITNNVTDADTPFNEVANENVEAIKGPSFEGIESTSGQKLDEQASNVVIPDHETSGTDSFPTEYSKEEKQQIECSSITSSSTIEHDMKDYNPDCRTVDSTPGNITRPTTNIVMDDETAVNDMANGNQEAVKGPSSEGIESTSGQKLDEQASNVVILDQETSGTDSFPTEYSKEGEKQQTQCSLVTSSSTIEQDMKNFNPDCRMADSPPETIVMPTTNIVRDADRTVNEVANENQKAIKGPSSEGIGSTSGQKLDEQASNVVILDQETSGTDSFPTEYSKECEKQQKECSTIEHDTKDYNPDCRTADSTPENIVMPVTDIVRDTDTPVNEVSNEKFVAAESHHAESMVDNHEQKSNVEQTISVNPAEYNESKEIPNLEKAKEPCAGGIETTSDQKLISQSLSKLVITDEAMSLADRPPIEYSGLGETNQNKCNTPIIEACVRDSDPESKNDYSMQGNIMLPDLDRDAHIDANVNAQESVSEAAVTEVVHANSVASESVQSNARNTYSSSQDVARASFGAQLPEKELQNKHNEQGLEHSVVEQSDQFKVDNVSYTSCSASTTVADNSFQLNASSTDGHDDSSKESMDDVHGSKTESLKTCEPALWEELLESNAKESNNPEIYQDLGNAQQSPDNPFTYGQNFTSKEEAHPTFHIEGGHGLISEQLINNSAAEVDSALPSTNNRIEQSPITNFGYKGEGDVEALNLQENTSEIDFEAPADVFKAPLITSVEKHNHSEGRISYHEIQPSADLAPGGSQNGKAESDSERLERPHKPLRNLLAEEHMRGTQDRCKQDPPLVEQPKTYSQNSIQEVHASTAHVTDQGGTSSRNLEIAQKDSNSSSKKIVEKVWNSPARLPSPKIERQKVKVKSAWSMCLCGSAAN